MIRWIDPDVVPNDALSALDVPPILRRFLFRRGFRAEGDAKAFLEPESFARVAFPGADLLAARLIEAAARSEAVCVWGDFDVDGQTSTALLVEALRMMGARVTFHVPQRHAEGHGLHIAGLESLHEQGVRLVLTCDTGITANEAVAWANAHDMQILITDHHEPDTELPDAHAIINPKLLPDQHPLADLAGVGVAFKLAEVLAHARADDASASLDLVALGLIADVALLRTGTRALAKRGVEALRHTQRVGLHKLAEIASVGLEHASEEAIGFSIAPRLNSLGRLGDARLAVELLLTSDPLRARVIAMQIEGLNTQRRLLAEQVYQAAAERLHVDPSLARQPLLFLEHEEWPSGVLGIVASRLVEQFRKPAILLSKSSAGLWTGSARSIEGLHITRAIAEHRELLGRFGGHPMAAGLLIQPGKLAAFRAAIQRTVGRLQELAQLEEETLHIDEWIGLSEVSLELAEHLDQLAPFGAGNPLPVFATHRVRTVRTSQMGRAAEHRRLTIVDHDGARAEVRWWNAGPADPPEGELDIAYSVRSTLFRGQRTAALTFIGFRIPDAVRLQLPGDAVEVVDLRSDLGTSPDPKSLVWAEGLQVENGVDRLGLQRARTLTIWTSPPSRSDLRTALSIVRPRVVVVVARNPELSPKTHDFLSRLAGLAKFAIGRQNGAVSIPRLAASCASTELAVHLGLQWLASSGHISVTVANGQFTLGAGAGRGNEGVAAELLAGLTGALMEAAAYREYLADAPTAQLAQHITELAGSSAGGDLEVV